MFGRMIATIAAFALAACNPLIGEVPAPGSTSIVANAACIAPAGASTFILDEKTLYAAELAYNVPAHAYRTLNEAGQLTPALKASTQPLLVKAGAALDLARLAYNAKNAAGFSCQINAVRSLAAQASVLLPKR